MSTDVSTILPRKKRSILWFLAAIFLLLLVIFFFQLFGPNPPILVSPQTTYLTEPLGPKGLPDFERHVLEQYRQGVTPQNNAATLIWKALWPGELQPGEYALIAKELGLSHIPTKQEAIEPYYGKANQKRVVDWLRQQRVVLPAARAQAGIVDLDDDYSMQNQLERAAEEVVEYATSRPWTSEQIPPIAEWVRANQQPLDTLLEAARRPRCYFPSTSLIDSQQDSLIGMLLSGQQGARAVARSLPVRAMWHLGEGREDPAWQDLLAVHRIGRLVAQGNTIVEQLIGIAIDGVACERTQTLLHHGNLSVEQLQRMRRELDELPPFGNMLLAIDQSERLLVIDAIIHLSVMNDASWNETLGITGNNAGGLSVLQTVSVDWNLVLRDMNRWYDRLAAAAALPNRADRLAALNKVEADMQSLIAHSQAPGRIALSVFSRRQRSEVVAAMMLGIFLPALDAATAAEDRANAAMQLTRLAAALAQHRAAHGQYPENLDELVPDVLDKLPVDFHTASPFLYQRDGNGYILYSTGDNGKDDGGSNERMNILAGQPLSDLGEDQSQGQQSNTIPAGADDISIRLPRPRLKLPHSSEP